VSGLVVALVVLALVAAAVVGARYVRHPEQTAGHDDERRDSTSERFYGTTDTPAGPDADEPVGGTNRRPDSPETEAPPPS